MINLVKLSSKYKYIVLDFDGTIVNLNVDWVTLKNKLYKRFNCKYNFKSKSIFDMISKISDEDVNDTLMTIKKFESISVNQNFEVIPQIFLQLKKLKSFYIISNNHSETINSILKKLNFPIDKNRIIGVDTFFSLKPNIKNFNKLLELNSDYRLKNYVYIGDKESDKIFAKKAKIDFYYVQNFLK